MKTFIVMMAVAFVVLGAAPGVAAPSCKDVQTTSNLCLGDAYCAPIAEGGVAMRPTYKNGKPSCNEETHILSAVDSVDTACAVAKGLRQPINCAQDCTPGNISENSTTDVKCCSVECCSVVSERTCAPAPAAQ